MVEMPESLIRPMIQNALMMLAQFERDRDFHSAVALLRELGFMHQNQLNDSKAALSFLKRSLDLSEKNKMYKISGMIMVDMGLTYLHLGELGEALGFTERGVEILKQYDDEKAMCIALGNLGVIHRHLKNWDLAIQYSKQALEKDGELGDIFGMAEDTKNLAYAHKGKNDLNAAYLNFLKAADFYQSCGRLKACFNVKLHAIEVLVSQEEYDKAMESIELMLGDRKVDDADTISMLHFNRGFVKSKKNDSAGAVDEFRKALENISNNELQVKLKVALGDGLKQDGDFPSAVTQYIEAIQLSAEFKIEDKKIIEHACRMAKLLLIASFGDLPTDLLGLIRDRIYRALSLFSKNDRSIRLSLLSLAVQLEVLSKNNFSLRKLLPEFIEASKDTDEMLSVAQAAEMLGLLEKEQGNFREAEKWRKEALKILEKNDIPELKINQMIGVANAQKEQGNLLEALNNYKLALEEAEKINYDHGKHVATSNMAETYRSLGDLQSAMTILMKLIPKCSKAELIAMKRFLAFCMEDLNKFKEAIVLHMESYRAAVDEGDLNGQIDQLDNIGRLWVNLGQFDEAKKAYGKALELIIATDKIKSQANILEHLGMIHLVENSPMALDYFELALEINTSRGAIYNAAIVKSLMANCYKKEGNRTEAEKLLAEAISVFKAGGGIEALYSSLWMLGLLKRESGNNDEAHALFEEAIHEIEKKRKNLVLEEDKLSYGENKASMYYKYAQFKLLDLNQKADAFEIIEAGKSRAFIDLMGYLKPRSFLNTKDIQNKENILLKKLSKAYGNLIHVTGKRERASQIDKIQAIRRELNTIWDQMDPNYVALRRGDPINYIQVKALL